uniref:Uncharacterized protein LOC111126541 n=1 Tax=Crassostrea virginica TaxID=6565 RepID=A0A8B8DFP4_CRAVI|nr:uncharacterized protein LOC111126541 [Crassostrea virginica]XP_022326958.1 uncharacterized protein LOC111126541 [Crassostrea virginica]
MTYFVVVISVLSAVVLKPVPSFARTTTLTLKENRCYGPFNTTPRENFVVTHVEDRKSSICKDMSFSGWDDIDKVKREVCVKVIEFQLDCSQTLEYRTGTNRGNPDKSYDCKRNADTIPVFCTYELLYIQISVELSSDEVRKNEVKYTVYSGAEKDDDEDFPVFAIIGPLIMLLVVVGALAFAGYLRSKNAQLPVATGRAVYTPGQSPQVNVQNSYHPVDQIQPQGQPYQAQTYTQPSAPLAYPYPPGQEVYPPQTTANTHPQTFDSGPPPSYEEVTKRKLESTI